MNIRINVAASFLGQLFHVAMRALIVPISIRLMGIEAYGLVGFYFLLGATIQFLNFGLHSTALREIARMRGGVINSATIRYQLRRLAVLLFGISITFFFLIFLLAPMIATSWLRTISIPIDETVSCIRLMAFAAAVAFISNMYKAGLLALDRQVRLNAFNAFFMSIQTLGAVGVLLWISATPKVFFTFQAFVTAIELLTIGWIFYRHLPTAEGEIFLPKNTQKEIRRFVGGLAFTESVWAGVVMIDRLVLSKVLPLSEFGSFIVVTTAAYGVSLLFSPIIQALRPRFAVLAAGNQLNELRALYLKATYGLTALTFSAAGILLLFPEELIFAWVGNRDTAVWARGVLPIYALGNAFVGIMSLPFLLQFALGDIRLHIVGHAVIAAVYLPLVVWLGVNYGAFGTGSAWLAMNFSYFIVFAPLIHARILPGLYRSWILSAILPAAIIPIIILQVARYVPIPENRFETLASLSVIGTLSLAVALFCSPEYRHESKKLFMNIRKTVVSIF